ncbi:Gfo/Idh/MocA family oxidoreductase [Microbacterium sp. LRZ72]|uniref:Gfo/Idh/MocA family protein n=1 Tax=Microbacterium sp. LRZ72 TaxID=2942481 RepID=UPI0029B684C0|nr:Gfo/Idh/MocA family oxidoreductase [Microbacterium sp. LRZ72]MDX2376513.1 Gfo/Idh/MocA family oxidoreductase [Microbacterium sp. LRZ72]
MTRPLRVAVVGTGEVSRQVASDLALTPAVELYAVSSRSNETAAAFAARLGAEKAYGDYDDCLGDAEVDLVYLGTPHSTHHDLALRAIRAGKHVLVEKPMTMDAAHARSLADAARTTGVFLMEGMWTKFNGVIQRVAQVIAEGGIGEVRSLRASFGVPFPRDEGSRWHAELGGSSLLDQGIYPITLARMILGDPIALHAKGDVREDGVDLTGHLTLEHTEGRFAQLAWSMVEFIDLSAAISGTQGWITIHPAFWSPERATLVRSSGPLAAPPERSEIEIPRRGHGFVPMLQSVAESIEAGHLENPLHPMSETIAVLELMDRLREAL